MDQTHPESGSQRLIAQLLSVFFVVTFLAFYKNQRLWPDEGELLWKLGYFVGRLDSFYSWGLAIGALCLAAAAALQLIRILFRASRR